MNKNLLILIFFIFASAFTSIYSEEAAKIGLFQEEVPETPEAIPITPTSSPTGGHLDDKYFEEKIENLESLVKIQSEAYSATISRWESNLNLILTILGIATAIFTLLGFITFKYWIKNQIIEKYKEVADNELSSLIENEADRIRKEYEPKFAKLYDEYRKIKKEK